VVAQKGARKESNTTDMHMVRTEWSHMNEKERT